MTALILIDRTTRGTKVPMGLKHSYRDQAEGDLAAFDEPHRTKHRVGVAA